METLCSEFVLMCIVSGYKIRLAHCMSCVGQVNGLPRPFLDLFQTPEGRKSSSVTLTIPSSHIALTN